MSYDTLLSPLSDRDEDAFRMDYPCNSFTCIQLLGSCNGLLCIRYGDPDRSIFFWNPATKEFKILPKSNHCQYNNITHASGFGYDGKTDDYKLITVEDFGDSYLVDVYTLRTDSWRSSELHTPHKFSSIMIETEALANGNLHWICKTRDEYNYNNLDWLGETGDEYCYDLIISLDISDEKFNELQLPADALGAMMRNVGVLEGCLCALSSTHSTVVSIDQLEVWVMQSWTRRYTITNERFIGNSYLNFIWSFKNGEILVETLIDSKLVIYDPNEGSAREPKIFSSTFEVYSAENYVESLVSLSSYVLEIIGFHKG
ncbi:F-box/kelch-repeat protein At3g06240-like [Papaver somniferum]|uniref:F-box/kelch-repeat protein At3g06240-like n=1 Tax=Papaver somniferum TaxID=3469 RepID=UPI000E704B28|nr:F-box/kelch-repeat protein At3g06240-like [Papaver somniferum]